MEQTVLQHPDGAPSRTENSSETPDRRVVRTRAAIADAAFELFVEGGWDAITHQRVAERADVGRNTVYRHFPDRTALLLHAGHFDQVHHAPITGEIRTDLIEELRAFQRELFDGIVGNVFAAMLERADHDPEIAPMRDRLVEAGAGQMWRLIADAVEDGRMSDAVSVHELGSMLCGPLVYARLCSGRPMTDQAIEHLVDTHLAPGRPGDDG